MGRSKLKGDEESSPCVTKIAYPESLKSQIRTGSPFKLSARQTLFKVIAETHAKTTFLAHGVSVATLPSSRFLFLGAPDNTVYR
jgi:hypothetical protein